MKNIKYFIFLLLAIPVAAIAQPSGSWPVSYGDTPPTHTPSGSGTRIYLNISTNDLYNWNPAPASSWVKYPKGFDQISGCAAPGYTPTARQSVFAINSCTVLQNGRGPELYYYTGSTWLQINEGQTYEAGTGIDITDGVISSTATGGPDSSFVNIDGTYTGKRIIDTIKRDAPLISPVWDKGGAVYNVAAYGIFPDGSDNSALFLSLLEVVRQCGGGKIVFNSGIYNFNQKILVPTTAQTATRNGRTVHRIADMTWEGVGSYSTGFSNTDTFARKATVINLNWGGDTLGRIDTRGLGRLCIRNIAFHSPEANSTPFILTTNTTLSVEACSFTGTGPEGDETVFTLGTNGSGTEYWSTGTDEPFQGYGTVLQNNFFNGIGTGFYLKSNANAIVIQNNTFWWQCGGYAAIRLEPIPTPVVGNLISGNLIEMAHYDYGIVLGRSVQNSIIHNNFYDNEYGSLGNILHKNFPYTNTIIQGSRGQSSEPDFVELANPGTTNYIVQNSVDASTVTPPTYFYSPIWLHQDSLTTVTSTGRKYYFDTDALGYNNFKFGFTSPLEVSKNIYGLTEVGGDVTQNLFNDYGKYWRQVSSGDWYEKAANNYILGDTATLLANTKSSLEANSSLILSNDGPQPGDVTGYGLGLTFRPFLNRSAFASIMARYETSNTNDNISLDFWTKTGGIVRNAAQMNARGFRFFGNYFDMFSDGSGTNDRNYSWANNYFNTGYLSLLKNFGSGAVPTANVMTFDRDGLLCLNCTNPQERFDIQGNLRLRALTGSGNAIAALDANGVIYRTTLDPGSIAITPISYTNAAAPNNCIFYSTTDSKLSYKDPGGTVHSLY